MATINNNNKERYWAKKAPTGQQKGRLDGTDKRYHSALWQKVTQVVRLRDNNLCQQCKREGQLTEVGLKPRDHAIDHITPVIQGGSFWDYNNLETLCVSCHAKKSGREAHNREGGGQKL